jgi:hypothetical protein
MSEHNPVELPTSMDGIVLIPLCPTNGCDQVEGHEGEHGPVVFNMERALVSVNGDRIVQEKHF